MGLNRDKIIEIWRFGGCKDFVSKRKYLIDLKLSTLYEFVLDFPYVWFGYHSRKRENWGHISHVFPPPPPTPSWKLRKGWAKCLNQYLMQSSTLSKHGLDFWHQSASKAMGLTIKAKFRTFWPPVKIMGRVGKIYESIFHACPRTQRLLLTGRRSPVWEMSAGGLKKFSGKTYVGRP